MRCKYFDRKELVKLYPVSEYIFFGSSERLSLEGDLIFVLRFS